ncbi:MULTISPECIES: IS21 family transposase [unclassified Pseudoalteromonas]|uniref:IS21 family transposase n=1 Tax=unclassified Pseudoalteromonas TaxID=194690 RepID=UPI0030142AC8
MLSEQTIRQIVHNKFVQPTLSSRQNAAMNHCSHFTVNEMLKRFEQSKYSASEILEMDDDQIYAIFHPVSLARRSSKRPPPYDDIQREVLKRKGKTLTVLYLEYVDVDPHTAYGRSRFFELVRHFLKTRKVTMRQRHFVGEEAFIDYAGTSLTYIENRKQKTASVFIGCLGASNKLFAYATTGQTTQDWVAGIREMLAYFGGVPQVIVIDNAKGLVKKAGNPPKLVRTVDDLAEHFHCLIHACRVGHPQDKSLAEQGVKFITQRILRVMNSDFTFFSLDELNQHLVSEVEKLNALPLQNTDTSRNQLFEQLDGPALSPLPKTPFNPIINEFIKTVPPHYHIQFDGHDYSVPYDLCGEKVTVQVYREKLNVFYKHKLVTTHLLSASDGCTTLPKHMHPSHHADLLHGKSYFLAWAKDVGIYSHKLFKKLYKGIKNPQSRAINTRAKGIKKLCEQHGAEVFEAACRYALAHGKDVPCADELTMIISAKAYEGSVETENSITHSNIRGKSYYEDGGNDE